MISNNPMLLQEQDFHAKHSDLLQAAREGKAWEPADNPRFGLCSQLVTSEWRYVSRIANIDISDVPDAESTARKYVSEAESPGLVELAECSTIRPSGPVGTVTLTPLPPSDAKPYPLTSSIQPIDYTSLTYAEWAELFWRSCHPHDPNER